MADYVHGFEGSTDGTQITTGTFGSDNPFTAIVPANAPPTNAWTFSTTGKITGTLGGRINISSSTAWRAYNTVTSCTQFAGRWGFTFNGASMPAAGITIAALIEGTGFAGVAKVVVSSSGTNSVVVIADFAGTALTDTHTLTVGTAYYIELQVDMGASNSTGTINAQLYTAAAPGTLIINYTSGATRNTRGTGTAIIRAALGNNDTVTALDMTFDDVLWRPATMTPVGPPIVNAAPAATLYASGTVGFPAVTAAGSTNATPSATLYAAGTTGLPAVTAAGNVSISGPDYGGSAADLGNGSGSWVNPGNATGTNDETYASWTVP